MRVHMPSTNRALSALQYFLQQQPDHDRLKAAARIKWRILTPVGLTLALLLALFTQFLHSNYKRETEDRTQTLAQQTIALWNQLLEQDAALLREHAYDQELTAPPVISAWKAADRQRLLSKIQDPYRTHARNHRITHLYYINPDRTVFLRAHNPSKYGDKIERATLLQAQRLGREFWGLELGSTGTLTLRLIRPLRKEAAKPLGYLETGMEITGITDELRDILRKDYILLLRKSATTQAKFEAGKKLFNYPGNWNDHQNFVVLGRTLRGLPSDLISKLEKTLVPNANPVFSQKVDGTMYSCIAVPVRDVTGRHIADLLTLRDISHSLMAERKAFLLTFLFTLFLGLLLFWLIALVVNDTQRQLFAAVEAQEAAAAKRLEMEERLAATLYSIGDGVICTDSRGIITDINKAGEEISGWPLAEARGRRSDEVLRLLNGMTRQRIACPVERVLREKTIVELGTHAVLITRDGIERQIADSAAPIRDRSGGLIGVVMVFRDVSEVEAANKAKSQFLANMSHELRTPLHSILASSEMLGEEMLGPLTPKQRQYLANVRASGQHLLNLVNDVLHLSKIEAGKLDLEPNSFRVGQLLESALGLVRGQARQAGLELQLKLAPEADLNLKADERKLKQAVTNLLSNAVKFTPKGGKILLGAQVLTLQALRELNAGAAQTLASRNHSVARYLRVYVSDTGIGIAQSDLPKLFRPFSQVDSSDARAYGGTGLGLVLVKEFVELHRGLVWAQSSQSSGSTFNIALPLPQ